MFRDVLGVENTYQIDVENHLVRNKKTGRFLGERTTSKGSKFYRLSINGKKRDISFFSLQQGIKGLDETVVCAVCGKEFSPYNTRSLYCSKRCKKYHDNRAYNGFHIRRAKKYGVRYERGITLDDVIAKYNGVCQICGEQTDAGIFRKMPTIDHIVPMKLGGSHTMDNIQLACFACNSAKDNQC